MDANEHENTIVSPFLVKLLLSILAEAAGQDTSTHRELLTILPSIRTEEEIRELYGRTFGSLLVNSCNGNLVEIILFYITFFCFIYSIERKFRI